jgi:hypothetical protein
LRGEAVGATAQVYEQNAGRAGADAFAELLAADAQGIAIDGLVGLRDRGRRPPRPPAACTRIS